ncbi:lysophosphatidic acid phosphatase type 6-like [Lineus longissimus]|uniref:lysophosphatidic acid phosphatase type 6-like n=1 Tax=Lineus longissimus TaxID=88925 RepID=UPI00315CD2CA
MSSFLHYNKSKVIITAAICTAPLLANWWGKNVVVFASEGSGQLSPIHEFRQELIDSIPRLKKTPTDRKYSVAPPMEDLTLKHVQIFFRHGARTPVRQWPIIEQVTWDKDVLQCGVPSTQIKYNRKYLDGTPCAEYGHVETILRSFVFKGGIHGGQLTDLGHRQLHQLGLEIRRRYMEERKLVPEIYQKESIHARSTNLMRTIESTKCVLAGLFGRESLEENEVVPDIMVAKDSDEFLYIPNINACQVINEMVKGNVFKLPSLKGERALREEVMKRLGLDTAHHHILRGLMDEFNCRKAHGFPMPDTVKDLVPMIIEMGRKMFRLQWKNDDNDKCLLMTVGPIYNMIFENMDSASCHQDNTAKMHLFGVHDLTLLPMLLSLKVITIDDSHWPGYGENINFELYEDKSGAHWVRILHGDKEITLPNCEAAICRYEQFKQELSHLTLTIPQYRCLCDGKIPSSLKGRCVVPGERKIAGQLLTLPAKEGKPIPASI